MPPDPDQAVKDPEEIPYFFDNWCSLPWSPWVPFSADKHTFHEIPHEPGVYRIRPVNKDFLMYIGETRRSLHTRLQDLRMDLRNKDLMPWSDPHTEAPGMWSWNNAEGYEYECSAAPLDASISGRRGMESFLLYQYRQERGESPLCNFGRFHPRYRRSTIRKEGLRGGKLAEDHKDNPAGGSSIAPLGATGKPGDSDWMGLAWTGWQPLTEENIQKVPAGAGVYLLADAGSHEIVYIGQSADVAGRLLDHCRKTGDEKSLRFSYQVIDKPVLPHNLRERENDLIGNYYEHFRKAPEYQFRNVTGH
jgi:hypothetical protein